MHKYCESLQVFEAPTFKPYQKVLTNLDTAQYEAYIIATPAFKNTIYTVHFIESDIKEL